MNGTQKTPGESVSSATVAEILVSTGVQLVHWAHDIAFTDAPFGETWCVEAANRMATLSEILHVLYKKLEKDTLDVVIDFPDDVVGVVSINPDYKPEKEEPTDKTAGSTREKGGDGSSLTDFPF